VDGFGDGNPFEFGMAKIAGQQMPAVSNQDSGINAKGYLLM
jgi:hypothetical protein